jgi:hypothetical protein
MLLSVRSPARFAILCLLAIVAGFVAPADGASASPRALDLYNQRISNLFGGKCLDEDIGSPPHNGTRVQVWECNGWTNQQWSYYSDGTIVNSYDGRCLDADISSPIHNGTVVQVWACNGQSNQRWTLFTNTGLGPILSAPNSNCLDEDIGTPLHDGTKVQLWNCNAWDNQQWAQAPTV